MRELTKFFCSGTDARRVASDVSFSLTEDETLALVGESGAGKSTTGRLALRLIDPDAGSITFQGSDVRSMNRNALRGYRKDAQMIFKDPFSSLNPRVKIWKSVAEPMVVHGIGSRHEHRDRAAALLDNVGLSTHLIDRYPTNLSGGQLQRAAIASALANDPSSIVCDEPVFCTRCFGTGRVINLLLDIQQERGVSYLFITHDLALAETFAQSVDVMRSGAVVEQAPTAELFSRPRDEYTRTLLNAIPGLPEREAS